MQANHRTRLVIFSLLAICATFIVSLVQAADEGQTIKVGVLKFGTVNWELKAMQRAKLDVANGISVEIIPFASGDATKIALQGGAVDIIVSDWLWVSRQRAESQMLTFAPYSSSVGAIMVGPDSSLTSLADLKGVKIGVAGGPLDKSWLMLQGMAKQEHGFDLAKENEVVFGAPPLLAEKTRTGELDAMLNFWHYCARLEADGFKRLISVADAASAMGAKGPVSAIGYVFSDEWANANSDAAAGFIKASKATKELMKSSDDEWTSMQADGIIKDEGAALIALRDRFREGIPSRSLDEEIEDASTLYKVLADLGGEKLVGKSPEMVEGTYWPRLASDL